MTNSEFPNSFEAKKIHSLDLQRPEYVKSKCIVTNVVCLFVCLFVYLFVYLFVNLMPRFKEYSA